MGKVEGLGTIEQVGTATGLFAPQGQVIEVHAPDQESRYWRIVDDEGRVTLISSEGGVVIEATGIVTDPVNPEAQEETEL